MANDCPPGAPVELADGKIIFPEDPVTLAALCELVPLLLETMAVQAQGANGRPNGAVQPGAPVPIAGGQFVPSGSPAVPTDRPGAIGGYGGQQQRAHSGGFPWGGGGGGRGAPGQQGPQGPPGPGTILPVIKEDGNFTVASVSPFVPIPGTSKSFKTTKSGASIFLVQAVFGGNAEASRSNGQLGVRIDGTDFPLTANLLHTGAMGVDQFLASVTAAFPRMLSVGDHTVELVLRGDASLGAPTGSPVRVQANATIPLALTIIHQ